ncbi:MAG: helix-turn-helix domain-containing protein [Pseudobdellovibrionaceae bacterium]
MVAVLQRHERGEKSKDLCREFGISSPTLYAWKQIFARLKNAKSETGIPSFAFERPEPSFLRRRFICRTKHPSR